MSLKERMENWKKNQRQKRLEQKIDRAKEALLELSPQDACLAFSQFCDELGNDLSEACLDVQHKNIVSSYDKVILGLSNARDNMNTFRESFTKVSNTMISQYHDLSFHGDQYEAMFDPYAITYWANQYNL